MVGVGVGGGGGVNSFWSNFGATKDTEQNFQLLAQYVKNTQQVYSRTGARYVYFYISMFVVSLIMVMNE